MTTTVQSFIQEYELTPQEAAGTLGNFVAETTMTSTALPQAIDGVFSTPTWVIVVSVVFGIMTLICLIVGIHWRIQSHRFDKSGDEQQAKTAGLKSAKIMIVGLLTTHIILVSLLIPDILSDSKLKSTVKEEVAAQYTPDTKIMVEKLRYTDTPEGDRTLDEAVLEVATDQSAETVVYDYNDSTGKLELKQ